MMKIQDIVGDIVLLVLEKHKPLQEFGLEGNKLYTSIVGYDEYGVWIKYPNFPVPIKSNPPKKKAKPKFKKVAASMLIPWGYIISIVHFSGVEGFDFASPFDLQVGFDIKEK